ncbi:serine/threonine-protein kinase CDL1 [Tripterygium wilfordii]|uniref:Serine/threonine-protein kinase CDL1 n=1 Tax=Tripterygium wilfordii TaxID=458696 RepID=A0A7J7CX95_TRIWF|nr:serine/threonine-protein kinase CDL1 [Tripterygium wilfordii]
MGGCFPCFGSSNKEGKGGGGTGGVKEVVKKDSVKDGSLSQSHHVSRVSSVMFIFEIYIFLPIRSL